MTTIDMYGIYRSYDKTMVIVTLKQTKTGVTMYDNIMGIKSYIRNRSLEDVIQIGIECKIWDRENDKLIEKDNVEFDEWNIFEKRVRSK